MTAQVPDKIRFEDLDYFITGIRGAGLFHPVENGLEPLPHTTACWRGFACRYAIVEGRLQLMALRINLREPPDTLLGSPRSTSREGIAFPAEYRNLSHDVLFSGELLAGNDFIQELYAHMGFHPAWKFRHVQHFTFAQGLLMAQRDRSDEAAEFRRKVARSPDLGKTGIGESFGLHFDPWAG